MTARRNVTTFGRIMHIGVRNFMRNAWLSSAATAVMLVTLTILLSSLAVNMTLNDTIEDITDEISVSVFLFEGLGREDTGNLETELLSSSNVDIVRFKSSEEALAEFQDKFKDDPKILESAGLVDNFAPASYEISISDLSQIDSVIAVAESPAFADVVEDTSDDETRRESIQNIASAQDFITLASVVMALLFGGIAVLIIFNTIRMAIFTRQEEIGIMKLIGATPGYIRGPFLLEASLYGIIAGILAIVIVYSGLLVVGPSLTEEVLIDPTIDFFVEQWYVVFFVTLGAGLLIGFLSSSLAMSRYLRLRNW